MIKNISTTILRMVSIAAWPVYRQRPPKRERVEDDPLSWRCLLQQPTMRTCTHNIHYMTCHSRYTNQNARTRYALQRTRMLYAMNRTLEHDMVRLICL